MSASGCSDDGSTQIDAGSYRAATNGNFQPFANHAQPLDHIITRKEKNSILHLHLSSPFERSKDFVDKVLSVCPNLLWQTNDGGDVPLHIAAKNGHHEIVKLLINEAKKPVHRDLETGEEEVVRRLLRSRNKQGETALHLATRGNFLNIVKQILEHEDPDYTYNPNKRGESPLYVAANYGVDSVATEILNKFQSPDCSGPNGSTVFHTAAFRGILGGSTLDLLLNKVESFLNQADELGWTPLHYAAYKGRLNIVGKILGKDRSSAYATDKERNRTPLHMASIRGDVDVMKEIIDKCPECWEITDVEGCNVLHYAVISRCEEAIKTMIKDLSLVHLINWRNIKGHTPLHLLLASDEISSLLYWLESDESASHVLDDEWKFIFLSSRSRNVFHLLEDRIKEEIMEWMKDISKGPFGGEVIVARRRESHPEEIEHENVENLTEEQISEVEKGKNTHLVVAALVSAVTFAAAFTLPGGYISNENDSKLKGTPMLARSTAFRAFIITDTIAMLCSTSSVLIHSILVLVGYRRDHIGLVEDALISLKTAMVAMVIAFVTGTYTVLAPSLKELAVAACVIVLLFFFLLSSYIDDSD